MQLTKTEYEKYAKNQKCLPTCALYRRFLELAMEQFNITINQARDKYGLYTVEQWEQLLKLKPTL